MSDIAIATIIAAIISAIISAIASVYSAVKANQSIIKANQSMQIAVSAENRISSIIKNEINPTPVHVNIPELRKPPLATSIHVLITDILGNINLLAYGKEEISTKAEVMRACGALRMYVTDIYVKNICKEIIEYISRNPRRDVQSYLCVSLPVIEATFGNYLRENQQDIVFDFKKEKANGS